MRGVFLPKDVIAKDVLENMDHYIRRYPPKKILHILWKFTIPLYIKIYKMYVNRGKNNEENMQRNEDAERKL